MRAIAFAAAAATVVLIGLSCKDAAAPSTNPLVGIFDLDSVAGATLPVRDTNIHNDIVFVRKAMIVVFEDNSAVIALGDSLVNSGAGGPSNYTSYFPVSLEPRGDTLIISYGNNPGLLPDTAVLTNNFKLRLNAKSSVSPLKLGPLLFLRTSPTSKDCQNALFGECVGTL